MERLRIQPTDSSLGVDLNSERGVLSFTGESRPENAPSFFEPIIEWLEDYRSFLENKPSEVTVEVVFTLDYFNSTSAKFIVDIAKSLKSIDELPNTKVEAVWNYKSIDEDIKESGEEIIDWTGLDFQMVSFE